MKVENYDYSRMSIEMVLSMVSRMRGQIAHVSEVSELEKCREYEDIIDHISLIEAEMSELEGDLRTALNIQKGA